MVKTEPSVQRDSCAIVCIVWLMCTLIHAVDMY